MHKKILIGLVLFGVLTALLAACAIRDASGPSGPEVHMNGSNFTVPSITVHKGDMLNLIDDAAVAHIIFNGSWDASGKAVTQAESGAPTVNNLKFNGNDSSSIGPFNTAGTFHYYCSLHQGMNLAVIVQ